MQQAGGAKRIKLGHCGQIDILHPAWADRYVAAMTDPPVKIPAQFADDEIANGRSDDPDDPDGWSFNDDAETSLS